MADDKTAASPAAELGTAMAKLAAGMVGPQGKPMSALELAELRSLMATGTYKPAEASAAAAPQPQAGAPSVPGAAPDGPPLSATDIAAIKTMMLVRPYVPHPMPGATETTPETTTEPGSGPPPSDEPA